MLLRNIDPVEAPLGSDEYLALKFTQEHLDHFRYVSPWNKWLIFNGTVWVEDETRFVFCKVREVCRDVASSGEELERKSISIASASTVAAVEKLSKADERLAAIVDQWDRAPFLLNTPGGTVELESGTLRRHDPDDFLTKCTAVSLGGECPLWHRFIERITGGDSDLASYLARLAGYSATGLTREHAMFFFFGTGANGKSVFLNTVSGVLGSYSKAAPIETFTASSIDRHPTELAMLRGARLVTAIETEEGRQLAEARIKSLTGGDRVSARFMRQNFFEYQPTFKLVLAGNHKPGLRGVDEAIRRRINLVPFGVTIPREERDQSLQDALVNEWPGILRWIVDGCLEYQKIGLSPPRAVEQATNAYLEQQDNIGNWLAECSHADPDGRATVSAIFDSWKRWCSANGVLPGSRNLFMDRLRGRGFEDRHMNDGRNFFGFRLTR
jgi:putative DNA primase/helicase